MKEKLIIKNFGPIKDIELELNMFNILIGEQATGKSTVAKVLAVCRYFSYIVNDQGVFSYPVENRFKEGLIAWGLDEAIKPDSYIQYECRHYTLKAEHKTFKFSDHDDDGNESKYEEALFLPGLSNLSDEFKKLLKELDKIKPKSETGGYELSNLFWTIPTSFFQNDVAAVLDNPFYVPTERGLQSVFSLGKNSIPNINDSLFNQLARLDQIVKAFNRETEIEPLNVTYKNETGRAYVRKSGESEFYSLAKGASGFQSAIPIFLTTKYYTDILKKVKTLIIEEPELNLYPSTQDKLVQFLVDKCNSHKIPMLLTTHSPYILTSTNNLLQAYRAGLRNEEMAKTVIEKRYWLNPKNISAYKLLSDGAVRNIMDIELNQIQVEEIDEISDKLSKDWHNLKDIEE